MGSLAKVYNISKLGRVLSVILPQATRKINEARNVKPTVAEKKRPASAFASFYREKQASLKENNPELKQKELMKLASSLWHNESPMTRLDFKNEYNRSMEEYRKDMIKVPKRPSPPYIQFFQDNNHLLQSEYPNVIERAKKVGDMWHNLSGTKKERYRSIYSQKLNEFNENLSEEEKEMLQQKRQALNAKRERRDIRRYGKQALKERPKNPIINPFNLFIRTHAAEVPHGQNIFKYLGKIWCKLTEDEKSKYKEQLSDEIKQFENELSMWESKYEKH